MGIATIFTPLGFMASLVDGLAVRSGKEWTFLAVGSVALFIGLLTLRLVKVSYAKLCRQFGLQTFGLGSFGYDAWFGLVTVGRAAPLLISMLSIAAVNEPFVGAASMSAYVFLMGMPIVVLSSFIGIARVKNLVIKHSRKLEAISGLLLLEIGGYYFGRFIIP